jgi:hypothetical protein
MRHSEYPAKLLDRQASKGLRLPHRFFVGQYYVSFDVCADDAREQERPSLAAFLVARGLRILQDFAGICSGNGFILLIFGRCVVTHNLLVVGSSPTGPTISLLYEALGDDLLGSITRFSNIVAVGIWFAATKADPNGTYWVVVIPEHSGWPSLPQHRISRNNLRPVAGVTQEDDIGDRTKTQHGQRLAVGGPAEILNPFRIIEVRQLSCV